MPDIFISYSSKDKAFAEAIWRHLKQEGVNVFLAAISLVPGQRWTPQILDNLKSAPWVIFLASRAACASSYVQQELGAALITGKKIVPIVWDMPPSELPGWIDQIHALNIAGAPVERIRMEITNIAQRVKADKRNGLLTAGALILALFMLAK
jgi:hypothetical protein